MEIGKQDIQNYIPLIVSQYYAGVFRENSELAEYSSFSSHLYIRRPAQEEPMRISFLSNDSVPNHSLVSRSRRSSAQSDSNSDHLTSILSHRSSMFGSNATAGSDDLGGHETLLLDMVRAQSKELEEAQDKTLDLPKDDASEQSSEACIHGLSMRYTERSISRSRVSRISTKRDMDIPSILAFTTSITAPSHPLENPAFQKAPALREEIPRWSIRRSVCPVCSQKWRDRSAVSKVKYSGLKRSSTLDMPSVIAPARLRASITMAYTPRPALAVVDEDPSLHRVMRNNSATWQLTRARWFRSPKPFLPPPEATAPPSAAAPLARKDLDIRVNKFLTDNKK